MERLPISYIYEDTKLYGNYWALSCARQSRLVPLGSSTSERSKIKNLTKEERALSSIGIPYVAPYHILPATMMVYTFCENSLSGDTYLIRMKRSCIFLVGSYLPDPGIKFTLPGTMVYTSYCENSFSGDKYFNRERSTINNTYYLPKGW